MNDIMSMREATDEFKRVYREHISRPGADKLLEWIEATDFFTAPASTKFHCAFDGGLVIHSVSVYHTLRSKYFNEETDSEESFAICALLHDLCKAKYYKKALRNVKNEETGAWEKKPYYQVEDAFPYGHGEKSVFLIERRMRLGTEEAMAIRWHMGGFDESVRAGGFALSQAFEKYPLAVKLHLADLESTYLMERGTSGH